MRSFVEADRTDPTPPSGNDAQRGVEEAAVRMARYGATFVVSNGGVLECDDGRATDFTTGGLFTTVYDEEGVSIWRLARS